MDQLEALDISDSNVVLLFSERLFLRVLFTSKVRRSWGRYIGFSSDQQGVSTGISGIFMNCKMSWGSAFGEIFSFYYECGNS